MLYPNLFKSRYPAEAFRGKAWVRNLEPEDLDAFVQIGLEAADHGRMGGEALVKQKGRKHMKAIARRGAHMTNLRKYWNRLLQEELLRLEQAGEL